MDRRVADYGGMLLDSKIDMVVKIVMAVLLCLFSVPAVSQMADVQAVVTRINEASATIESLECNFVQTNHVAILDDAMVLEGRMSYERPENLRWEYTKPYSSVFVLNEGEAMMANGGQKDSMDMSKSRVFKRIAGLVMDCMSGKALSDERLFGLSVQEEAGAWKVSMTPKKNSMKQMVLKLVLHYDPVRDVVSGIEMHEPSGNYTEIRFEDINLNQPVSPSVFRLDQEAETGL